MPAKKRAVAKEEEEKASAEVSLPTAPKKASKKNDSSTDKQEENVNDAAKPKKVAKREEVQPTRRGGDRAAKKVAVENLKEGRSVPKKSGGTTKKANRPKPGKAAAANRGRQPKSSNAELSTDDSTEKNVGTVAVEH